MAGPTDGPLLVTGAQGRIGSYLRPLLLERFGALRSSDRAAFPSLAAEDEVVSADLRSPVDCKRLVAGCGTLLHLAGHRDVGDRDQVFEVGIRGTFNLFEAARRVGIRRIVYASSLHAIGFYEIDAPLDAASPPRPDSFYAVSKLFGESLLRYYSERFGIAACCLRIGSFLEAPTNAANRATWLARPDLAAIVLAALSAPLAGFRLVHALSATEAAAPGIDRGLDGLGIALPVRSAGPVPTDPADPGAPGVFGWDYLQRDC
jgi:uronate dehydrogenase